MDIATTQSHRHTRSESNGMVLAPAESNPSNDNVRIDGAEVAKAESASHEDKKQPTTWEMHPQNPFNWPNSKKWRQFLMGCTVTLLVGLNSTAIATPGIAIAEHFDIGTSNENIDTTVWPITAWNTGAAFGPMVGLPLLEAFGIRIGYLLTYVVFFLFVVPQAVATNFATMIVTRAIAGIAGGVLMNSLENFVADTWLTDAERDLPITLYVLVYLAGVTLGPAFGAISSVLYWRWVFYIQLIIYGALFPCLLIVIKETRGPVILSRLTKTDPEIFKTDALSRSASKATSRSMVAQPLKELLYDSIVRPAHMLFTEPVIICFTLWSAFCFGIVYICIQSITQIYQANYDFSDAQCGLVQIAPFIGMLLGAFACIPQNKYYQRTTRRNDGIAIPEARLPMSVLASLIGLAGGLFWYAWASRSSVAWILPTVGLGFVGFGVQIVVTAAAMYVTDAYSKFAGSAIANVAFGENMMAAWLPLATRRMYNVLGFQWASSLLGFAALVLTMGPIILLIYGEKVRNRSPFIRQARYLADD